MTVYLKKLPRITLHDGNSIRSQNTGELDRLCYSLLDIDILHAAWNRMSNKHFELFCFILLRIVHNTQVVHGK